MRDYKKYEVWVNAHDLTLFVYKEVLPQSPKSEQYELASQLKRATYSIPLNIADGCGRNSDIEFARFLDIALGSLQESEYCLLLASDLKYINEVLYVSSITKLGKTKAMLINLIKKIRK